MNYSELSHDEFDAVVTGELTHYAIWLESELDQIITGHFVIDEGKQPDFRRLLLQRDGLTAQDKIEIVRSMLSLFALSDAQIAHWKRLLKRIEDFKSLRNAMAHGVDVTERPYKGILATEIVTRSGRPRTVKITPESHSKMVEETGELLTEVQNARETILRLANST